MTYSEIELFLSTSGRFSGRVRTFCWMVAATGCRISEALALTPGHIDFEARHVTFRSLKKRGRSVFRSVPLPVALLSELDALINSGVVAGARLWPWSRMTGYRRICEVMKVAGISGPHASPKGLRHGFAIRAIQVSVPLNLVQRWLGHADIKTTAIYSSAIGPEEREIASRMWGEAAVRRRARTPLCRAESPSPPCVSPSETSWTSAEAMNYFQAEKSQFSEGFT